MFITCGLVIKITRKNNLLLSGIQLLKLKKIEMGFGIHYLDDRIDVIATDHAPHTFRRKI